MANTAQFISFLQTQDFKILSEISTSRRQLLFNGHLYIKILEDLNKEVFIELCCRDIDQIENWYDMALIRFFILKLNYKAKDMIHFEELSAFFLENFTSIMNAFGEDNYAATESALKQLQNERGAALLRSHGL